MKTNTHFALRTSHFALAAALLSALHSQLSTVFAQGTAFTYQGRLNVSGSPAHGVYDFTFQAFDALTAGTSLGGTVNVSAVGVTNGLFTVAVDFGSAPFTGPARWLQISVSTNGAGSYSTLAPRQPLTPAPYTIYANTAGTVTNGAIANAQLATDSVAAANIQSSTITAGKIASGQVVKSLNGLSDAVSITQGANVTINTMGNSLQISAPAGGLNLPFSGEASGVSSIFTLANSGTGAAAAFLGNVGIGTSNPATRLEIGAPDVGDGVNLFGTAAAYYLSDAASGHRSSWGYAAAPGFFSTDADTGDSVVRAETGKLLLQSGIFGSAIAIDTNNNVGIGTTTPQAPLHVVGPSGYYGQLGKSRAGVNGYASIGNGIGVYGNGAVGVFGDSSDGVAVFGNSASIGIPAKFRRPNDGIVVDLVEGVARVGTISVSGGTVSYNPFTGSHFGWTDETIERGTLVRLTGANRYASDDTNAEIIYGIARTTQANDSRCLGAYLSLMEPARPACHTNPCLVMAVGNGDLWVTDGGNAHLQPGDYLISSSVPGCAMKDDPGRFPVGYVCARAAEGVNWGKVAADANGVKRKKISILFENFERHSGSSAQADNHIATVDEGVALAAIQGLNQKMEEREALLRRELERRDSENAEFRQRLDALEKIIRSHKSN